MTYDKRAQKLPGHWLVDLAPRRHSVTARWRYLLLNVCVFQFCCDQSAAETFYGLHCLLLWLISKHKVNLSITVGSCVLLFEYGKTVTIVF